jgi:hypothetical protein
MSRGDREHLSRTGKDFGLTQEATRKNGRCKFQSSKKNVKNPLTNPLKCDTIRVQMRDARQKRNGEPHERQVRP